ncbi:MAG UNVERIFIED_CONTAM: hypothetical protein LVT10_03545 [Anaerolineae bacterium]
MEQAFIEPEQKRLYRELARPETTHERRRDHWRLLSGDWGYARRGGGEGRHAGNRLGESTGYGRRKTLDYKQIWYSTHR